MKPFILSIVFVFSFISIKAQSLSGVMTYRQRIHQEDTTFYAETVKELVFNQFESISKTKTQAVFKGAYSSTNISVPVSAKSKKGIYYANFTKGTISSVEPAVIQNIFLVDTIGVIPWKILNETKYFGKLLCRKAESMVRGRLWIVWFCPDIPVSAGPWKLYGLPGLIVEAMDSSKKYKFLFESIDIPAPEGIFISPLLPNEDHEVMNKTLFVKKFIQNSINKTKMTRVFSKLCQA